MPGTELPGNSWPRLENSMWTIFKLSNVCARPPPGSPSAGLPSPEATTSCETLFGCLRSICFLSPLTVTNAPTSGPLHFSPCACLGVFSPSSPHLSGLSLKAASSERPSLIASSKDVLPPGRPLSQTPSSSAQASWDNGGPFFPKTPRVLRTLQARLEYLKRPLKWSLPPPNHE